jgi:hypothetical protein
VTSHFEQVERFVLIEPGCSNRETGLAQSK